jgi:hypothetical protein
MRVLLLLLLGLVREVLERIRKVLSKMVVVRHE